jgi:hypothetical protein
MSETGNQTHRATERGYAKGELIEPGQFVPAGVAVSEKWMESLTPREANLQRATEEALDPQPGDVDVDALKGAALTAYAATLSINREGLSDADLRAAVRAKREINAQ